MAIALILLEIIAAIYVFIMIFHVYYDWKLGVPTVTSSPLITAKTISLIPPGPQKIVEMGSGRGVLAMALAKARPDCEITAIEFSLLPYIYSRILARMNPDVKNLKLIRQNFLTYDLSKSDVIFCYLLIPAMAALKEKFLRELQDHALVISNAYIIKGWTPIREETVSGVFQKSLYVYNRASAASQ